MQSLKIEKLLRDYLSVVELQKIVTLFELAEKLLQENMVVFAEQHLLECLSFAIGRFGARSELSFFLTKELGKFYFAFDRGSRSEEILSELRNHLLEMQIYSPFMVNVLVETEVVLAKNYAKRNLNVKASRLISQALNRRSTHPGIDDELLAEAAHELRVLLAKDGFVVFK